METEKLISLIQERAPIARKLEPETNLRRDWTEETNRFAFEFIDSLPTRKAFKLFGSLANVLELKSNLDHPKPITDVINELKEHLISYGLNPASGGHLGYIPGGGVYAAALGDYLAAVSNQYAGIYYGGPAAVKVENELIRWMIRLFGYPSNSHGNLTSGGSIANLIAIVTAREARQIASRDIERHCIYLTEQVHHCIHKAIRIAGLAECQIRSIPMDSGFRMDMKAFEATVLADIQTGLIPFLAVGSAGTTDTGAIDPLEEMAVICKANQIWFHIDAAYGGFFKLCELENPDGSKLKDHFKGIAASDSLVIDPHKGLFLPYGLGAVLIKDVVSQYKAHYYKAAYMQDTLSSQEEWSPADLSPELTKHFRGLRLWLPLKLYGLDAFKACLEEKILLCRYFYEKIGELGFEKGPYPETSVCIYRYLPENQDPNEFNKALVANVLVDGRVFVSSTTIAGFFWIRIAILSFRTSLEIIDTYLLMLQNSLNLLKSEKKG